MIDWLARLPTTNTRIAVTIGAFVATIMLWLVMSALYSLFGHYTDAGVWVSRFYAWEPSDAMKVFLSAWVALDVAQFFIKRKTQDETISSLQNGSGKKLDMSQPPRPSD